jgi:hypothetical protein
MIVYQLGCAQGHFFEGWFASAQACEKQTAEGLLACPTCASPDIHKLPSAPHVHTSGSGADEPARQPMVANEAARHEALVALRKYILENTQNVGRKFAEVARRIHYKEEDSRAIRGQVTSEVAAELREEGVSTYTIPAEVIPSEEVH